MLEGELKTIAEAWEFQREAGISEVPVSIDKYLQVVNARVIPRKDLKDEEAGQVFKVGEQFRIIVNANHSVERQRFTILHELAHIRLKLPSNHEAATSVKDLFGYQRRPREEILCDIFASECLLPKQCFRSEVLKSSCTFSAIQDLAERFEASLTATGSRFAAYCGEDCAWVLCDQQRVRHVSYSPSLRQKRFFIRTGIEIPKASVLGRLSSGHGTARPITPEILPAHVWLNEAVSGVEEVTETALVMSSIGQGVALIVGEPIEEQHHTSRDDDREDVLLRELDGVLHFPGRRRRR